MNEDQRFRQQAGTRRRSDEAIALWDSRRAEVERHYFELGWTQKEIGSLFECSQGCIAKHMLRWGHVAKKMRSVGHRNGRYKDGKCSRPYRLLIDKVECAKCKSAERLAIHHKNNDHFDNRLENLKVLCAGCHMSAHKTAYWEAKRKGEPTPKSNGRVGWAK